MTWTTTIPTYDASSLLRLERAVLDLVELIAAARPTEAVRILGDPPHVPLVMINLTERRIVVRGQLPEAPLLEVISLAGRTPEDYGQSTLWAHQLPPGSTVAC